MMVNIPSLMAWKKDDKGLLSELQKLEDEDTAKVLLLAKICWEYRSHDFEKALKYGMDAVELAEAQNYYRD